MTTRPPITYTRPTPNPELDAARHDDDLEAALELHELAATQAPAIVFTQFAKIVKPGDWFDKYVFAGAMSADELLYQATQARDDAVIRAYAELMVSDAAEPLRNAIAENFAERNAFGIYTDWLEDQQ